MKMLMTAALKAFYLYITLFIFYICSTTIITFSYALSFRSGFLLFHHIFCLKYSFSIFWFQYHLVHKFIYNSGIISRKTKSHLNNPGQQKEESTWVGTDWDWGVKRSKRNFTVKIERNKNKLNPLLGKMRAKGYGNKKSSAALHSRSFITTHFLFLNKCS